MLVSVLLRGVASVFSVSGFLEGPAGYKGHGSVEVVPSPHVSHAGSPPRRTTYDPPVATHSYPHRHCITFTITITVAVTLTITITVTVTLTLPFNPDTSMVCLADPGPPWRTSHTLALTL